MDGLIDKLIYPGIVTEVYPESMENSEYIVTGHISLKIKQFSITAFIPSWTDYFPSRKKDPLTVQGSELIRRLTGKRIKVILGFLGYDDEDHISHKKSQIIRPYKWNDESIYPQKWIAHYALTGRIISKAPYSPPPKDYEYLILDCGLKIFHSAVSKKYQIGDYIMSKGRLDIEIVHLPRLGKHSEQFFNSQLIYRFINSH